MQVERTFRTNVYSQFFLTRHLLPSMPEGGAIINTASVNAYKGNATLIDYTASKGANVAFTRALALQLASRNIRVNGAALPLPHAARLITDYAHPPGFESAGLDSVERSTQTGTTSSDGRLRVKIDNITRGCFGADCWR